MRSLAAGFMRVWRLTVGAVIPDSCRFTPSCSHYAAESFHRRGVILGSIWTIWRLLRCHPFHPGGYDPVVHSQPACLKTGEIEP
jgi:hypothetical protein